jgi:hypothetical protein
MGDKIKQIRLDQKTFKRMGAFMKLDENPEAFISRLLDLHQDYFLSGEKKVEPKTEIKESEDYFEAINEPEVEQLKVEAVVEQPVKPIEAPALQYKNTLREKDKEHPILKTILWVALSLGLIGCFILALLFAKRLA